MSAIIFKTVGGFLVNGAGAYIKVMGTVALVEFLVVTSKDITDYVTEKFGKKNESAKTSETVVPEKNPQV